MTPEQFTEALKTLGWKQSDFCRRVDLNKSTPSAWVTHKAAMPKWVGEYLGLLLELQRLHATYLAPGKVDRGTE